MSVEMDVLRLMVKGAYDLQALRMQTGLRLCANFRAKLKENEPEADPDATPSDELSEDAQKLIDRLKSSYKLLTGVARNRTLPTEKGFTGDELISSYSELVLVDQYLKLESQEATQFRQMQAVLDKIPIYVEYLSKQIGIGPAMAGALLTTLNPHKARNISSFWSYSGLDVASDGYGRSRRQEHLVEREYQNKEGKQATRLSVTYNPWLKTKLFVLATSFMRSGSSWRRVYDDYKHRLTTDPLRQKATVAEYKKRYKENPEQAKKLWTPGRIDMAAKRYMLKIFLADFWVKWRTKEGLPVTAPYAEDKQGRRPHAA